MYSIKYCQKKKRKHISCFTSSNWLIVYICLFCIWCQQHVPKRTNWDRSSKHAPVKAVPLCSTCCLFIWAEFHNPSGLTAVDPDHLCTPCADWLLINELKQLGAFPSRPIRVWRSPFVKALERWGTACPSDSGSVLDTQQTSSEQVVSQKNLVWSGAVKVFLSVWEDVLSILQHS